LDWSNRRDSARRQLTLNVPVRDAATGALLGSVGDLSRMGLMLVAAAPSAPGARLDVLLDLSAFASLKLDALRVSGEVRWCRAAGEGTFLVGVQWDPPDEDTDLALVTIIRRLSL